VYKPFHSFLKNIRYYISFFMKGGLFMMNNFNFPLIPPAYLERKARPMYILQAGTSSTEPDGETPESIRRVYKYDNLNKKGITGKGQNIAIVVAFHYPTAEKDLNFFSKQFGLPKPKLKVHFAAGVQPPVDPSWALEAAIDIQWAHSLAPGATIHLVEAASDTIGDLLAAVDFATALGVQVVSMSWGDGENIIQPLLDFHFRNPGVVYTASSGNIGGVINWPAISPSVVGVGGTRLNRDQNGKFISETAWSGSGGGISQFFPQPLYQSKFGIDSFGRRANPDVSFVADPATGVAIFTSTPTPNNETGWLVVGGTSVSAPCWAGIFALATQIRKCPLTDGHKELYALATGKRYAKNYRDITIGTAGAFSAGPGYDFVTGLGSPLIRNLVLALGSFGDKNEDRDRDSEEDCTDEQDHDDESCC
jgi:subtilase family serine protease